jgi:hypothetical protein
MPNFDKLKAAFLKKSKLRSKLNAERDRGMAALRTAREELDSLLPGHALRDTRGTDIDGLQLRIAEAATGGARGRTTGQAWLAVKALAAEGELLLGAVRQDVVQALDRQSDEEQQLNERLTEIYDLVDQIRSVRRRILDDEEIQSIDTALQQRVSQVDLIARNARATPLQAARDHGRLQPHVRALQQLEQRAQRALLAPDPKSKRAVSAKSVETVLSVGTTFGEVLRSDNKNPQGQTARQQVDGQLEVFDRHFALPDDTESGRVKNGAMRLATIVRVTGERIAHKVNDPALKSRLARLMVTEYESELRQELENAGGEPEEVEQSVNLARALVMDDPVTRLVTGKISMEDAVQRIRDMAQVAALPPSEMMTLLRQQLEMQLGSLTADEVSRGEKKKDGIFSFVLKDLYGELSSEQLSGLVELDKRQKSIGRRDQDSEILWKQDGTGLAFKPTSAAAHRIGPGETLTSIAQALLGRSDEEALQSIRDVNTVLIVPAPPPTGGKPPGPSTEHRITTFSDTAVLPEGAPLLVPAAVPPIDLLGTLVSAWDTPERDDPTPKPTYDKAPDQTSIPKDAPKRPSVEELRDGISKLRRTTGTTSAPGLGQSHKVDRPLDGDGSKVDPDGALNPRQYAHLRMLQREDQDEKQAFYREHGQTVEEWVIEQLAARYKIEEIQLAGALVQRALQAFESVPLTVTFKAERLFATPGKDEPSHGSLYASEVTYSRGTKKVSELIGRGDQTGLETVGVTGGEDTGWKSDRGENYMRWRTEKDDREGRRDWLAPEDQQIFGGVNPNFDKLKGGDRRFGSNYYGDAHFLLRDAVRPRSAFAVRGGGVSIGGGKSVAQRRDMMMMLYDMLKNVESNKQYLDAVLAIALGKSTVIGTGLDWEVHIYGGIDLRRDVSHIYVKPGLDSDVQGRVDRFGEQHGVVVRSYGDMPEGLVVRSGVKPFEVN